MEISASAVKELREKTGAGMMDCKKALSEVAGDFDKAIEYLRKKGIASAAKKAGRATKEGTVASLIQDNGSTGVLVEINCETDFVARTEQFKGFVKNVLAQVAQAKPASADALLAQSFVNDSSKTMEMLLKEIIATLGENMTIRRLAHYTVPTPGKGFVTSYIHGEGKVGVLVEIGIGSPALATNDQFITFARDVAMHIAAAQPQFVKPSDVPSDLVAKEKEIALAQMQSQNKPQAVLEKIAEGKIKKFYEEVCLIHQPFVKNPDQTIDQLTQAASKAFGQDISIKQFTRFVLGEGVKEAADV